MQSDDATTRQDEGNRFNHLSSSPLSLFPQVNLQRGLSVGKVSPPSLDIIPTNQLNPPLINNLQSLSFKRKLLLHEGYE